MFQNNVTYKFFRVADINLNNSRYYYHTKIYGDDVLCFDWEYSSDVVPPYPYEEAYTKVNTLGLTTNSLMNFIDNLLFQFTYDNIAFVFPTNRIKTLMDSYIYSPNSILQSDRLYPKGSYIPVSVYSVQEDNGRVNNGSSEFAFIVTNVDIYKNLIDNTDSYQALNAIYQTTPPTYLSDDDYRAIKAIESYNNNYILYNYFFDRMYSEVSGNNGSSGSSVDLSVVNNQLTKIADSLNVQVESDPNDITKSITEVLNDKQQSDLIQVNTTEYPIDFKRQSSNSLDFTE